MRVKRAAVAATALALAVIAACSSGTGESNKSSDGPTSITSSSSTSTVTPSSSSSSASTSTDVPVPDLTSSSSTTTPPPTTTVTSKATIAPTDPLTGEKVSTNPVIAAKIDNTSFPQFGVADADIIYTEQVEGGLTRLIAIFHTTLPKEIGPVRSIRSTDFQLLPAYGDIILVNSGGDTVNLRKLTKSPLVGVSEGAPGFWRSKDRNAPYNLHANVAEISKNHPKQPKARSVGFEFATHDSAHLSGARRVSDIDVTMIVGETSFKYVRGSYAAYHGGKRYVDADGRDVTVQNVIIQHVTDKPDGTIDPIGNPAFMTTTVGSGKFTLYRDDRAIEGTWSRTSSTGPTTFLGSDGTPVKLKPGKTWVLLAPQNATVNKG